MTIDRCSRSRICGRVGGACAGPRVAPGEGNHEPLGFLATEASAVIAPIHPKAMPVILTTPDEFDCWLECETSEALQLQQPLPDDTLTIVAKGEKEDPPLEYRLFG